MFILNGLLSEYNFTLYYDDKLINNWLIEPGKINILSFEWSPKYVKDDNKLVLTNIPYVNFKLIQSHKMPQQEHIFYFVIINNIPKNIKHNLKNFKSPLLRKEINNYIGLFYDDIIIQEYENPLSPLSPLSPDIVFTALTHTNFPINTMRYNELLKLNLDIKTHMINIFDNADILFNEFIETDDLKYKNNIISNIIKIFDNLIYINKSPVFFEKQYHTIKSQLLNYLL